MKKRYCVISAIVVSVVVLAAALWWLTERVLPNLGIVHLVPIKEKARQLPQNGDAIIVFKDSKFEGYRGIKSIETDWSGVGAAWPHILVGIILGAVAGYLMGLPKRMFIEFAEKSLAHSNDILSIAERKESDAARKMSEAEVKESRNSERSVELDRGEEELNHRSDVAEKLLTYAHGLIQEAEADVAGKDKELAKAKAKIRRLKNRNKEKTIDEDDEQD